MITIRDYRRKLLAIQKVIGELIIDTAYGADMKEVNDKLVAVSNSIYEFSMRYKEQEEGIA